MCPHATAYVSSHYYATPDPAEPEHATAATEHATHTCPHTTIPQQIPLNATTALDPSATEHATAATEHAPLHYSRSLSTRRLRASTWRA
jgi:hypothetical protein